MLLSQMTLELCECAELCFAVHAERLDVNWGSVEDGVVCAALTTSQRTRHVLSRDRDREECGEAERALVGDDEELEGMAEPVRHDLMSA